MCNSDQTGTGFPPPPEDKAVLEEGDILAPRFDSNGLVTAMVVDHADGTVLMLAYMNAEALSLTISTGIAHYYSRSRAKLWKKGETSGNLQIVKEVLTDCDQDAILLRVEVTGHDASCHTGRKSCFYRRVDLSDKEHKLVMTGDQPRFDPNDVY